MTVAAITPLVTYTGNGSASSFSFPFPVFTESQILVSAILDSTGVSTTLVLGVDYSVSGLNSAGTPASSGTITLLNASQAWLSAGNLASGYTLQIEADFPLEQGTSIRNQGDFDRAAVEDALDNLEYQIQQLMNAILVLQAGASNALPTLLVVDKSDGHTYRVISNNQIIGLELVS